MEGSKYQKGEEAKVTVGGKTLILRPLSIAKIQKLLKVITTVLEEIGGVKTGDGVEIMKMLPDMLIKHFESLFPIIIDAKDHPFIVDGWAADNFTIPAIEEVLEATYIINGIGDFLGRLKKGFGDPAKPAETVQAQA